MVCKIQNHQDFDSVNMYPKSILFKRKHFQFKNKPTQQIWQLSVILKMTNRFLNKTGETNLK